ncbi:MAG: sensor histidine kinase [Christensenellales bacterium]|jgi:two-component system sensor histidine kinase AgrC
MQKAITRKIRRYFAGGVDVFKLARAILALSVVELGVIVYLLVIRGGELPMSAYVLMGAAFVGVLLSIQGAMALTHACAQVKTVEQTLTELEELNRTLRAQRHDFKNHVQVMSALLEMGECGEAKAYIARLSQDLRNVGLALRTAKPAVNALLQAKANICDSKGIRFEMDIATRLETLPIEQWEFCRILGNLIDNAVEAQEAEKIESPSIRVSLTDVKGAIVLSVFNNGTKVPEEIRHSIFMPDVSTKGAGRGMGLAIVKKIAESAGGGVSLESNGSGTCFTVTLPYENPGDYEHSGFIKVD